MYVSTALKGKNKERENKHLAEVLCVRTAAQKMNFASRTNAGNLIPGLHGVI